MAQVNQTEGGSKPKLPLADTLGPLAKKYAHVHHQASITFGEEGETLKKTRKDLGVEVINTAADAVAQQTSSDARREALTTAMIVISQNFDSLPPSQQYGFAKDILFRTIEIIESRSKPPTTHNA